MGMKRRDVRHAVARLAAAHFVNDLSQSAVLGLLPFLVAARGLGYTATAGLVVAAQASSAVVQPLLGHRADRRSSRLAIPLTLLAGAAAVAAVGFVAPAAAVVAAGVATAAFHPESTRAVRGAAGGSASLALGIYSLGGNLGTALGPVLAATLVGALGWAGLSLFVPLAVLAAWLAAAAPRAGGAPATPTVERRAPARWPALARLVALLALRSGFAAGTTAFAPLYLVRVDHRSPETAGLLLTLALLAGVTGALAAGRLADRRGSRAVLLATLAPLGPLLALFTAASGGAAAVCLVLIGAASLAPYSVAVAAAQDCLPGREGLAAGIAMGLGTALGSALLSLAGRLADATDLRTALLATAVLPVLAAALAVPAAPGMMARAEIA